MLADSIPGVRVIKAFTNERKTIDKFNKFCDEWFKEDKKVAIPAAIFPSIITFLVTCGSLVIWFLGGNLVIGDDKDEKDFSIINDAVLIVRFRRTSCWRGGSR